MPTHKDNSLKKPTRPGNHGLVRKHETDSLLWLKRLFSVDESALDHNRNLHGNKRHNAHQRNQVEARATSNPNRREHVDSAENDVVLGVLRKISVGVYHTLSKLISWSIAAVIMVSVMANSFNLFPVTSSLIGPNKMPAKVVFRDYQGQFATVKALTPMGASSEFLVSTVDDVRNVRGLPGVMRELSVGVEGHGKYVTFTGRAISKFLTDHPLANITTSNKCLSLYQNAVDSAKTPGQVLDWLNGKLARRQVVEHSNLIFKLNCSLSESEILAVIFKESPRLRAKISDVYAGLRVFEGIKPASPDNPDSSSVSSVQDIGLGAFRYGFSYVYGFKAGSNKYLEQKVESPMVAFGEFISVDASEKGITIKF
jgi:hypothetical protein